MKCADTECVPEGHNAPIVRNGRRRVHKMASDNFCAGLMAVVIVTYLLWAWYHMIWGEKND